MENGLRALESARETRAHPRVNVQIGEKGSVLAAAGQIAGLCRPHKCKQDK